jgi:hypothetical protein
MPDTRMSSNAAQETPSEKRASFERRIQAHFKSGGVNDYKRLTRMLVSVFVFTVAILLNQFYGYFGYMPLDQSIIFDGAWRVLNSQIPHVDFWTPYGVPAILAQAAIFRIFGVSWSAYVFHASLCNAFFAVFVLSAGTRLGLTLPVALFFALVTAFVSYPPMGTPFGDNHAAIICSTLLLVVALGALDQKRTYWWSLFAPLGIVAFLTKQSPSVFVIPFCMAVIIAVSLGRRLWRSLGCAILSSAFFGVIIISAFNHFNITLDMWSVQVLKSARIFAAERAELSGDTIGSPFDLITGALTILWKALGVLQVRIFVVPIFLLSAAPVTLAVAAAATQKSFEVTILALFSVLVFLIFLLFTAIANNQPGTGLALLAVVDLFAFSAAASVFYASRVLYASILLPALVTVSIHYGWTRTRYVNDLDTPTLETASSAVAISPKLRLLQWALPPRYYSYERSADNYRLLLAELGKRNSTMVLFSDALILHALRGQKPVAPALFWHKKLSYPADGPDRALFDRQFRHRIVAAGSDLVVVDGERTWMGTRYTEFPWLSACLRVEEQQAIGKFLLIPLDVACVRVNSEK